MRRSLRPWLVVSLCVLAAAVLWIRAGQSSGTGRPLTGDVTDTVRSSQFESRASAPIAEDRATKDGAGRSAASTADSRPTEWGARANAVDVRVLREEDGVPIAGALVRFGDERGIQTDASGVARLVLSAELLALRKGNVTAELAIVATAPGRVRMSVSAPELDRASVPTVVLRLPAGRKVGVRLADTSGVALDPAALGMEGAAFAVTLGLASACGPVGGTLEARGAPPFRATPASWAGESFAWSIEVRGIEALCLHALLGDEILAAEPLAPDELDVVLRVDPAAFERAAEPFAVLVTDADKGPLAHARVVARLPHGGVIARETGADGRARFERALANDLGLAVEAEGFVAAEQRVRRPIRADVVVQIEPGRTLRGTVRYAGGEPTPELVGLYRAAQLGAVTQPIMTAQADAQGRFEFRGAPRDALVVVGLGAGDGRGFLPPRDSLPPTATWVDAGADVDGVAVEALFHEEF